MRMSELARSYGFRKVGSICMKNYTEIICLIWNALYECRYVPSFIEELAWKLASRCTCHKCSAFRKCYAKE